MGFTYTYYNFVKNNTPADAIILFPTQAQMLEKVIDRVSKAEITYFLYPRQVVFADETNNPLFEQVTHIAIVNGYGYEYVDYEIENKEDFAILAIYKQ